VSFSRFCDLVEPADSEAWSLRRSVRETIARHSPRHADLTAVLGFNINLHPRLTPLEVVYPGSIPSGGDGLTLRDLALEADAATRTLRLVNRRDGQPVALGPMSFFLPVVAPPLYRFLCVFAPLPDYRMGFWDRLRQWSRREYPYLPRLTLGDLVLERRRWSVPLTEVRELGDQSSADSLDALVAAGKWHDRRGIPRECFFRRQRVAGPETSGSWTEETRRWAVNARTARRKAQYLDFWNPFLVRLLVDRAHAADDGVVVFHECLPPTALYRQSELASAEELVVECRVSAINSPAPTDEVAMGDRLGPSSRA
jgi:hypothetical protein